MVDFKDPRATQNEVFLGPFFWLLFEGHFRSPNGGGGVLCDRGPLAGPWVLSEEATSAGKPASVIT